MVLVSKYRLLLGDVPHNLGRAYYKDNMAAVVMYVRPLHLVARFFHWLDFWSILPTG